MQRSWYTLVQSTGTATLLKLDLAATKGDQEICALASSQMEQELLIHLL